MADHIAPVQKVQEVKDQAVEAFWAKVAECNPTAVSGDLDPQLSAKFDAMATLAISAWMWFNVPHFPEQ